MAKILDIKSVTTKAGAPRVIVTTAKTDIWIPSGQWLNKCPYPLESYKGGDIQEAYYQQGEIMTNGDECTASDKVLKDFIASVNTEVLAIAQATIAQRQMDDMQTASQLFARKSAEARKAREAKEETPEKVS